MIAALAGCSEEEAPGQAGPGVLDLDVGPSDSLEGRYERNGAVYDVLLDDVNDGHAVALVDAGGRVLVALSVDEEGRTGYFDWPAMDGVDQADLIEQRPLFLDLAAAARVWGANDGRDAPAWIVPALGLPSQMVAPLVEGPTESEGENDSFGGIP